MEIIQEEMSPRELSRRARCGKCDFSFRPAGAEGRTRGPSDQLAEVTANRLRLDLNPLTITCSFMRDRLVVCIQVRHSLIFYDCRAVLYQDYSCL